MSSTSVSPPEKTFDCVAMKRALQERIRRATAGMSDEERLNWFHREADAFWRALRPEEGPAERSAETGPRGGGGSR